MKDADFSTIYVGLKAERGSNGTSSLVYIDHFYIDEEL